MKTKVQTRKSEGAVEPAKGTAVKAEAASADEPMPLSHMGSFPTADVAEAPPTATFDSTPAAAEEVAPAEPTIAAVKSPAARPATPSATAPSATAPSAAPDAAPFAPVASPVVSVKKPSRPLAASRLTLRQRKRLERPPPFESELQPGLLAELEARGIAPQPVSAALQASAQALREGYGISLHTPLVGATVADDFSAGVSTRHGQAVRYLAAAAAPREDRRVRVLIVIMPGEAEGSKGAGSTGAVEGMARAECADAVAAATAAAGDALVGGGEVGGSGGVVRRQVVPLELTLPKKAQFPSDSDSEAELQRVMPPAAEAADADAEDEDEGCEAGGEESRARVREKRAAAAAVAAATLAAAEAEASERVHAWSGALQEIAVDAFDRAISTKRLRGVDLALALPSGTPPPAACPKSLASLIVQLLGARNHVASDRAMEKLLSQLAPPPAKPTVSLLHSQRWAAPSSRRASRGAVSYKEKDYHHDDDDDEEEEEENAKLAEQFLPFGSVLAASGCSVRVTVSCAAGLAAELPLWGLSLRGDQAWLVRALRPADVVILREGEHSLLQATLHDGRHGGGGEKV